MNHKQNDFEIHKQPYMRTTTKQKMKTYQDASNR